MYLCALSHTLNIIVMQKLFIPALLLTLLAFGCSKSDESSKTAPLWVVSLYQPNNATPQTSNLFDNYTFEFNDDGKMVIHSPDGSTANAKWSIDATTSIATFTMVTAFAPLNKIMGDWEVTEQTDTSLKLKDIGPQAVGVPVLHFEQQ